MQQATNFHEKKLESQEWSVYNKFIKVRQSQIHVWLMNQSLKGCVNYVMSKLPSK